MMHFRVISHMLSSVAIHTIVVVLFVICYCSTIHYNIMLVITRVQFILIVEGYCTSYISYQMKCNAVLIIDSFCLYPFI